MSLREVWQRVDAAAARSGRHPDTIRLVAVSKGQSDTAIVAAFEQGVRDFGENRAPDLSARIGRTPADIRWHFVGRLQGNKVNRVRPLVHLLHSLDRTELAEYWARGSSPAPPALIEVNTSGEPEKAGVVPGEVPGLIAVALRLGIEVRGLMTMAPRGASGELARPSFAALGELRDRLQPEFPGLTELSMGMSDDYEVAVEEGATILRVGRAIFQSSPEEG